MRDGYENRGIVYSRPESSVSEKGPLLVMIHGGGFCLGMAEQEESGCRRWVRNHGGVAISIEHRLAPEVAFPVPVEDCWDTVRWIAGRADGFEGADVREGFVLGGT